MARKPNYDFEKRRKEMERKAKKDAKREDRQRRRAAGIEDDGIAWPEGHPNYRGPEGEGAEGDEADETAEVEAGDEDVKPS